MRSLLLAALIGLIPLVSLAAAPAKKATKPLVVTVLDADNGQPLPGATVGVRRGGYPKGETADADGKCTVRYDAASTYNCILCRKDGYVPTAVYWQSNTDDPPSIPGEFVVRLPRAKKIGGKVVDEAGKPVAGAKVILTHWPESPDKTSPVVIERIPDEEVKTDAEGRWSYNGYPASAPKIQIRVDHPDYIVDDMQSIRMPAPATLLDESAVLTLQAGVDIVGEVLSNRGKPIKGARVSTIRDTHISNDYGISTKTDAQGKFRFAHMRPQQAAITVTAVGFAPELQRVEVAPGLTPVRFVLPDASRLAGRIIDGDQKPVPNAQIYVSEWRGMRSIRWSAQSDADGRFAWPDAPADAVSFAVSKPGYRYVIRQQLTAGKDEAIVKMLAHAKVSGTVTDVVTHQPIDKFRVIAGTQYWESRPPFFSFTNAKSFSAGKYEMPIDANDETLASFVRIEADGYEPAVSGPIKSGNTTFATALKPGKDIAGTLTSPDGKPVAGAMVHLALPGAQVNIYNNQIDRSDTSSAKTDQQGRFHFGPQVGDIYFVVVNDAGYAFVKGDPAAQAADLKLTRWSRIEGVYRPGGAVKGTPQINIDELRDSRDIAPRLVWVVDASTDAAGKLSADHVPSFNGSVCTLGIGLFRNEQSQQLWMPARLEPGKTLQVNVEAGRTLKGRVVPASPEDALTGARGSISLKPAFTSPAGQWPVSLSEATAQAVPLYSSSLQPDGSFDVPSIAPGNYEYHVSFYVADTVAGASGSLIVEAGDGTADAGEIKYVRGGVQVGQPAPATLGRTFDGKPIRTADYAGKYIVAVVWDSCTGRSDAHLADLNNLAGSVAGNDKVALISVNMDAISCGMSGVPRRPATLDHTAWLRGYLSMADEQLVSRMGSKQWPAIVIIGPDGKVLARDLEAKNVAEKLAAAMQK